MKLKTVLILFAIWLMVMVTVYLQRERSEVRRYAPFQQLTQSERSMSSEMLFTKAQPPSKTSTRSSELKPEIVEAINVALDEHGLNRQDFFPLVEAVVLAESSGNPAAKNTRSGATGLMQITSPALIWYFERNDFRGRVLRDPVDLTDVATNLEIGISHIRKLWKIAEGWDVPEGNRWYVVLACYNWGQGNVRRKAFDENRRTLVYDNLPEETQHYISRIQSRLIYVARDGTARNNSDVIRGTEH